MNIFVLDEDVKKAAEAHVDRHVVKMILETAQLLSGALRIAGVEDEKLYKLSHKNHPSMLWTNKSQDNFQWLSDLGIYLGEEYTYRYNKIHKSVEVIKYAKSHSKILPDLGLTSFAQAMPDEYKRKDAVMAYRGYYRFAKTKLLVYTKRQPPEWIIDVAKQK